MTAYDASIADYTIGPTHGPGPNLIVLKIRGTNAGFLISGIMTLYSQTPLIKFII
jgi:hypothetical protein